MGKTKEKKRTIHFTKPRMRDRYTVKKLTNLLEPEVGTHQSKAKVEELMADPKVQVIVTER